jgi:serine/threonine protein kinase
LKAKYNESLKLYDKMHSDFPHKRPNCEDILERKNSWALNKQELKINDELENIIASKERENELTIYSILRFEDSFIRNGYYNKSFVEIKKLGSGSFGSVFKVKRRKYIDYYKRRGREYSAIKRIELSAEVDKNEIITEYLNYKIISRDYWKNEYLVKHFDAWLEESVVSNQSRISLYIEMELCDKTLDDVINEFKNDSKLKTSESLTAIGYYIASRIFIQILKGVNHLHKQDPPLIHRYLKPANILLKKCDQKGFCVKIADFRYMAIHKFSEQSHTADKGSNNYMAPEVTRGKKYDKKADIYSLGVIFQNLFDLEMIE